LDFTIRTASELDVERLIAYVSELRAERLPTIFRYDGIPTVEEETQFIREFASDSKDFFVAETDDRIVGNLGISVFDRPQTCHRARLDMSVLRSFRGQGIGSRLLDTAIDWCKSRSLRRLELEVLSNNPRAQRLYERKGFVIEGRNVGAVEVDGEYVDFILMCRFI